MVLRQIIKLTKEDSHQDRRCYLCKGMTSVRRPNLTDRGRIILCLKDTLHLETEQSQQLPAILPPAFPPYAFTISFAVPVSSSLIFLLSRGSYDAGSSVKLELSDNLINHIERSKSRLAILTNRL
jgi:hypothetical protein